MKACVTLFSTFHERRAVDEKGNRRAQSSKTEDEFTLSPTVQQLLSQNLRLFRVRWNIQVSSPLLGIYITNRHEGMTWSENYAKKYNSR